MDSQHRHELEQNDLAEALSGFGKWWSKWGNAVLLVVLAAAVSFTVYRYLSVRAIDAHERAWFDLAAETSPQALQDVARNHSDPTIKAMAYLRGGDLQLALALTPESALAPPVGDDADGAAADAQPAVDPATALEDAGTMYEQAAGFAPNATIKANALLGLASVAESKREFDAARGHYEGVLSLVGDRQPMLAAMAQARLDRLDELKTPVRFAPAAPAAPATPVEPTDTPADDAAPAAAETAESGSAQPDAPGDGATDAPPAESAEPASP